MDEIATTTTGSASTSSSKNNDSTPVISIANSVNDNSKFHNHGDQKSISNSVSNQNNCRNNTNDCNNGSKETVVVSVAKEAANSNATLQHRMNVNCQVIWYKYLLSIESKLLVTKKFFLKVFTPKTNGHATLNGGCSGTPIVSASILNGEDDEDEAEVQDNSKSGNNKKINGKISDLIQNSKQFQKNKQRQQQEKQQQQLQKSHNSNVLLNGGTKSSNTNSNTGTSQVPQSKSQLEYLAKVLGLAVTFQDFPKKSNNSNKTEFFSLVTIATTPPQVIIKFFFF